MRSTATHTISLRGYPEAVLATDRLTLVLPARTTAGALAQNLAAHSDRLTDALLHQDGTPRATTKVLIHGAPVGLDAPVDPLDAVTVLASLPCDG